MTGCDGKCVGGGVGTGEGIAMMEEGLERNDTVSSSIYISKTARIPVIFSQHSNTFFSHNTHITLLLQSADRAPAGSVF